MAQAQQQSSLDIRALVEILTAHPQSAAAQRAVENAVSAGLPEQLLLSLLPSLPVDISSEVDDLGTLVSPKPYLATKAAEPQYGQNFAKITYLYQTDAHDALRLFCRVHYTLPDDTPLAARVARLLSLAHRTLVQKTGRAPVSGEAPFDVWLCRGGAAGGEQWGRNLYLYDLDAPRSSIEWIREIVHEYSHLALPPIGGYGNPEYWANGYLGERLIIRWFQRIPDGPAMVSRAWGDFSGAENFDRLLIAPPITLYRKIGPNPRWLARKDSEGMRYLIGQAMVVDDTQGGASPGRHLRRLAAGPRSYGNGLESCREADCASGGIGATAMTNIPVIVPAYAKINLTLDVLSRRGDGYHDIRSVMQTVALHDTLEITPTPDGPGVTLAVTGDESFGVPADASNIAHRAAVRMQKTAAARGTMPPAYSGLHIALTKRIPSQAGLGGGSSDAAATLQALNRLFRLDLSPSRLTATAASLGADVPFFLTGGTAIVEGLGERVTPLPPVGGHWHVVIVKPPVGVSTVEAYAALDRIARRMPGTATDDWGKAELIGPSLRLSNDFQDVVVAAHPEIALAEDAMKGGIKVGYGPLLSGSGSALFCLVPDETAAHRLADVVLGARAGRVWVTTLQGRDA